MMISSHSLSFLIIFSQLLWLRIGFGFGSLLCVERATIYYTIYSLLNSVTFPGTLDEDLLTLVESPFYILPHLYSPEVASDGSRWSY